MTGLLSRRQILHGRVRRGSCRRILPGCATAASGGRDPQALASAIASAENARATTGQTRRFTLTAAPCRSISLDALSPPGPTATRSPASPSEPRLGTVSRSSCRTAYRKPRACTGTAWRSATIWTASRD